MEVESAAPLLYELIAPGAGLPALPEPVRSLNQIYSAVFQTVRPRTPLPEVSVELRSYASAKAQIHLEHGLLQVRLSDTLAQAPDDVQQALAEILIAKLFRKPVPSASRDRYRRYLNRSQVRQDMDAVRRARGRKLVLEPGGQHFDLSVMFEELNGRYFFGLMARPALGWSLRVSRTLLGHYDPSHNTIVISRALDQDHVPRLAVEYVLFHEMLHVRYPAEHHGSRRCVHTRDFKVAERDFERMKEAKALLRGLL